MDRAFINEQELQNQLQVQLIAHPEWDIDFAVVDLVPDGMNFTLRTSDGTIGSVLVLVSDVNGLVQLSINSITGDSGPTPQAYVDIVNRNLMPLIIASLDELFSQQVGAGRNLEGLVVTDSFIDTYFEYP